MMEARIDPEKFEVRGRIKHETAAAILFECELVYADTAVHRLVWFPLSQVHSIHREFAVHGRDRMFITPWIAKEKGLLDEADF